MDNREARYIVAQTLDEINTKLEQLHPALRHGALNLNEHRASLESSMQKRRYLQRLRGYGMVYQGADFDALDSLVEDDIIRIAGLYGITLED